MRKTRILGFMAMLFILPPAILKAQVLETTIQPATMVQKKDTVIVISPKYLREFLQRNEMEVKDSIVLFHSKKSATSELTGLIGTENVKSADTSSWNVLSPIGTGVLAVGRELARWNIVVGWYSIEYLNEWNRYNDGLLKLFKTSEYFTVDSQSTNLTNRTIDKPWFTSPFAIALQRRCKNKMFVGLGFSYYRQGLTIPSPSTIQDIEADSNYNYYYASELSFMQSSLYFDYSAFNLSRFYLTVGGGFSFTMLGMDVAEKSGYNLSIGSGSTFSHTSNSSYSDETRYYPLMGVTLQTQLLLKILSGLATGVRLQSQVHYPYEDFQALKGPVVSGTAQILLIFGNIGGDK
ncbi:MAG: hypothetical protein A2487_02200 [Candidatus Raymondbacteria bacterium RifOxyC12_full_50_8]|nr:MAG: hypothetical protein A2487_02200 [Candidatus Raymondbacteria bacterium RifOxyC12_full_50_8]